MNGKPSAADVSALTVGEVADAFGVTVRTLHHYDAIGLLAPSGRSSGGYRLYTDDDVRRLRTIVVYRRLGFSLAEVGRLLDDPDANPLEHLRRQREVVLSRLIEDRALLMALDRAMEAEMSGMRLTKQEQRELFGAEFSEDYAQEAEQRWGDTDAWRQSQQRTRSYSKDDWARMKAEADAVTEVLVRVMRAGAPPDSGPAMEAAEAHRQHISRWFYDCPPEMHRGLAEMYLADARFTAYWDRLADGLAQYVAAAMTANAARTNRPG